MKIFIIGLAIVVGVSCQGWEKGPDGYKYPKPQSRFDRPEAPQPAEAPAEESDFPEAPELPELPNFVPLPSLPKVIPQPAAPPAPAQFEDAPPALPSFVPVPSLPKVIPVRPVVPPPPAPFVPSPAAPAPAPSAPAVKSPPRFDNEYLPPLDVRSDSVDSDFEDWKRKYNKRYASPDEENYRRQVFRGNFDQINVHNAQFDAGSVAYDLAANKYCDLTQKEFASLHTGLKRDARSTEDQSANVFMGAESLESEAEDEVDWRKKGAVTPVKNQGGCASCWAFAANGALEGQNFLKTGKLVSLSEQNLIDCVKDNDGCDGGYMTSAYEYVQSNPGVDTEASYPYEEKNSTCRFDPANVGGECMNYMEIMIGNEQALKQAVATVGPVAAGIDGAQHSFQFYKSGYYFEPKCDTEVNHAVVVVGYGKTEAGEEYWICKNSWDTDWGEEGYVRMARNKNNHCGITSLASYPLV